MLHRKWKLLTLNNNNYEIKYKVLIFKILFLFNIKGRIKIS